MQDLIAIIVPLFLGIVFIILAMTFLAKRKTIIQNGIEAKGIIFDFKGSEINQSFMKYPIIRFVTKEGTWITKTSDYSFPFLKKGKDVIVIYNKDKPQEFIFKTSFDASKLVYIFLILGVAFLLIGLWLAYGYLTK